LPSIIRMIKSRRMRWAGHVAWMGGKRNAYRILVGKPKGPLGRPRHRWVDNIKMDLRETWWDVMDWIDLAQDRDQWRALVNMVMNLRVPQNSWKFLSGCTIGSFSRRAQLREWWKCKIPKQHSCAFLSFLRYKNDFVYFFFSSLYISWTELLFSKKGWKKYRIPNLLLYTFPSFFLATWRSLCIYFYPI
jgi:hypothetical protein